MEVGIVVRYWEGKNVLSPLFLSVRMSTSPEGGCYLLISWSVFVVSLSECSLVLPLTSLFIQQTFMKILLCVRHQ